MSHHLRFPGTRFSPLAVEPNEALADRLDASNSPVLFGCRTGLCGTCLVLVQSEGVLVGPDADEEEILEIHAPDLPHARLACQLRITADCSLEVPPP